MSEDDFESIGSLVTEMNGEDLAAIQSNVSIYDVISFNLSLSLNAFVVGLTVIDLQS